MTFHIRVLTVINPNNEVPIVYHCNYEDNKKSLAAAVKSACEALNIDMSNKNKFSNTVNCLKNDGVCWIENNYTTDYCFQVCYF